MENQRFEEFSGLITGIYRNMQRLKAKGAEELSLKQVHVFWIYLLLQHPEGMTAAELARAGPTDRSLISREIDALTKWGYLSTVQSTVRGRPGWRFVLTELGEATARRVQAIAASVQEEADAGIPPEELAAFYRTLNKLSENFHRLAKGNTSS